MPVVGSWSLSGSYCISPGSATRPQRAYKSRVLKRLGLLSMLLARLIAWARLGVTKLNSWVSHVRCDSDYFVNRRPSPHKTPWTIRRLLYCMSLRWRKNCCHSCPTLPPPPLDYYHRSPPHSLLDSNAISSLYVIILSALRPPNYPPSSTSPPSKHSGTTPLSNNLYAARLSSPSAHSSPYSNRSCSHLAAAEITSFPVICGPWRPFSPPGRRSEKSRRRSGIWRRSGLSRCRALPRRTRCWCDLA
jgi:hypothetical protein